MIGVIGMIAAITLLIVTTYKGMNGLIASLLCSIVVIVTNGMDFWETFRNVFGSTVGSVFASYFFFYCTASCFGELMKQSGAAVTVSNALFNLLGPKLCVPAALLVTFLLAYSGINAFVIVFIVFPLMVPMFERANVSKILMPAIFLFGSVIMNVTAPGSPSALMMALSNQLGTNSFSSPVLAIICLVIAFGFGFAYFSYRQYALAKAGIGFVPTGDDLKLISGEGEGRELPPLWSSIVPIATVIILKFVLTGMMPTANDVLCTSILAGCAAVVIFNYKFMKGHILQDFTTGWWSSMNALVLMVGMMGFASVVNNAPGFVYFQNFAESMSGKLSPYLSAVVVTNIFSGITGASLNGTQIFCQTMADSYMAWGCDAGALQKVVSIASMGLDTLPHCPTYIMMAAVIGVSTKEAYKDVCVTTVIFPIVLSTIAALLATIGIVF